jgi:hypothetical protein
LRAVTLLLLFLVACFSAAPEDFLHQEKIISKEEPQAHLQIFYDKNQFSLSEVWRVKFIFTYPATYQLREKYLSLLDYYPLVLFTEPIEESDFDAKQNLWKKSFLYILEAPTAGDFLLQRKEFVLRHLDNQKKIFLIAPQIKLQVSTSITAQSDFQKIDSLIEKDSQSIYYIFIAAVVLLVIAVYFWRRKKTQEKEEIAITKWALMELKKLGTNKLVTAGEIKNYHLELSRILRIFFEKQFSTRALAKTREEFLQQMAQNKKFKENYQRLLRHYLELNDLVKFANYRTSVKHNEEIFELVEKIITSYHK